nr:hypothetical protein [Tanacetum cinerariifolium]
FALACGPTWTPISINSCVVDGVRYVVYSRDERRITQNNGICSPGPDGEMYYDGQSTEVDVPSDIIDFVDEDDDITNDEDALPHDLADSDNKDLINVDDDEDDPDIIHFDNSSDLPLSTSLNDLDNATLHIDGQSTEVNVPSDIIDVVDEDDDITNDEDALPHDLADSDNKDLINVDDDGVDKMSADVARSHDGDGGGEDRPPLHHVPSGCMGCFANPGRGKRKPNLGGREEMRRLEATGTYTDDEINRLARGGKQRGHISGVGRFESGGASGSGGCEDDEEGADRQDDEDEDGDGDTYDSIAVLDGKRDHEIGTYGMSTDYCIMKENVYTKRTEILTWNNSREKGKMERNTTRSSRELHGIVAEEGIPYERSPANIPRRHVAGEYVPPWHLFLDWKICGTHRFAEDCRWGRNPLRAFPSEHSPMTSRRGNLSPATSRRGKPGIVDGEEA